MILGDDVTPHLAQNHGRNGGSAIDGRTARHESYRISQRKRIEECFGWLKTIALPQIPESKNPNAWTIQNRRG